MSAKLLINIFYIIINYAAGECNKKQENLVYNWGLVERAE